MLVVLYESSTTLTRDDFSPLRESLSVAEKSVSRLGEGRTLEKLKMSVDELQAALIEVRTAPLDPLMQSAANNSILRLSIFEYEFDLQRETALGSVRSAQVQLDATFNKIQPLVPFRVILSRGFRWLGELTVSLAWPLFFLGLVLYFTQSQNAPENIARLFRPFKSVKLFSAELVLKESHEAKAQAEETIGIYHHQVKSEFDLWIQRRAVKEKLRLAIEEILPVINDARRTDSQSADLSNYRCTVHVRDLLFEESLYQLLDYYPAQGGRGRTWSYRFGIIGKVWRSGKSLYAPEVPTDVQKLILDWGMTSDEAVRAGHERQSFLCVILKHENIPVGLLYMDSKEKNAFGDHDYRSNGFTLLEIVAKVCEEQGLTATLNKIDEELRGRAPMIEIYQKA
jgi:hypothetical protein